MATSNWWHVATTEQKLAQITGGIECGMTAQQIAMCSGARVANVSMFAVRRSIHFPNEYALRGKKTAATRWSGNSARKSYLAGEPVDLWADTSPRLDRPAPEVEEVRF